MRRFLRLVIILVIGVAVAAQVTSVARAQTSTSSGTTTPDTNPLNLTLSPVTLTIETNPGVPTQTSIKIRNNGTTTETLNLSFGTFMADESGQKPRLLDPQPNDAFMSWLTAEETNFTIKPGEWKTVKLTFAPPSDAALSYYYTVIVNRNTVLTKPGETTIKGAPAILVLTKVNSPNARLELQLDSFAAQTPFLEFLPQSFQVRVSNTGNVHSVPSGNIFIDGQGKKDLAVLSLNPNNSAVLPGSSRTLEIPWADGFPVWDTAEDLGGPGIKIGSTVWNLSNADRFRIGKYTAHLLMVYDNGERDVPIESFVSFWVIPWRLLGLIIAVPVIPPIVVFIGMRWFYRRRLKATTKQPPYAQTT